MAKFVIILIAFVFPFTYAFSDDQKWPNISACGDFLLGCKYEINSSCNAVVIYASGLIDGMVYKKKSIRKKSDFQLVKYSILKFCKMNPKRTVKDGAISFFNELSNEE